MPGKKHVFAIPEQMSLSWRKTTNHYKYKTYYVVIEKEKESTTSYKGHSPNEYHLLSLMEKSGMVVFGVGEAVQVSDWMHFWMCCTSLRTATTTEINTG
ncbi:MAG: hypothetical protein ACP5EK_00370 [Thermoplasmatota archaeon]